MLLNGWANELAAVQLPTASFVLVFLRSSPLCVQSLLCQTEPEDVVKLNLLSGSIIKGVTKKKFEKPSFFFTPDDKVLNSIGAGVLLEVGVS